MHAMPLLDDITVVDFTRYLPGPICTQQLAWLGAHVINVQRPPYGDPMRAIPPLTADGSTSLPSVALERGKTIELLDLADAHGIERARQLCCAADVVLEGFRPGVAHRLGIDAAELRRERPQLIHCSISGYGHDGPWAHTAGHDLNYQSIAGTLFAGDAPRHPGIPLADIAGGMIAATAICAALVQRGRTGAGASIDISLADAAAALNAYSLPSAPAPDEPDSMAHGGMLTGAAACYGIFECADASWVAIAPIEPHFFAQLCTALDLPQDIRSLHLNPAPEAQSRLRNELATRFRTRDADAWESELAPVDGCVTRIRRPREAPEHAHLQARGTFEQLAQPDNAGRTVHAPASPFVIDGARTFMADAQP